MSNQGNISETMAGANDDFSIANGITGRAFSFPIEVIRWGFITNVAIVTGGTFQVSLDKRIAAGSDVGIVLNAGGEITLLTADEPNIVAGKGVYTTPLEQLIVIPGEELVWEINTAASSGTGYHFVHYVKLPFQKLTKTYAQPAGLPDADMLRNLTEVL